MTQDLDADHDCNLTPDELRDLAGQNSLSLKEAERSAPPGVLVPATAAPDDASPTGFECTTVGGSLPKKVIRSRRRSFLRSTDSSAAFTPCSWKTCFDVSIPMQIIWSMDGPLRLRSATTSFWHGIVSLGVV